MSQLPKIYTIQASDAPQHAGKLTEILNKLKTENRIEDFSTVDASKDLSFITDTIREQDLILILLTNELESQKGQIESRFRDFKATYPNARIVEIIIDNVPYDNTFLAFPTNLIPVRESKNMDSTWADIEQSLRDMLPAQVEEPAVPIDWPKYLKIAGVVVGLLLLFLIARAIWGGGNGGMQVRPPTATEQEVEAVPEEAEVATEDNGTEEVEPQTEPPSRARAVNLDFRNLGDSRAMDRRIANMLARQGVRRVQASSSGNYCSDARPAILSAGTYRSPVSFLSTASPGALNRCNTVPLEFEFSSPVQEVEIRFYGASTDYLLVPWDVNGRRLGSSSAQGDPYNYDRPFIVSYSSDNANISRVTFGSQAALTMVLTLTATR